MSATSSVSTDDYAVLNRLSITVKVRFTNALDEKMSFNRTFTAFEDYESTRLLSEVEGELIPRSSINWLRIFFRLRPPTGKTCAA